MKEYTLIDFVPREQIEKYRDWEISFDWDLDDKKSVLCNRGDIVDKVKISPNFSKETELDLFAPVSAEYNFYSQGYKYNKLLYVDQRINTLIEDGFIVCKTFDKSHKLLKEFSLQDFLSQTLIEEVKNMKIRFSPASSDEVVFFNKGSLIAKAFICYDYLHMEDYDVNIELIAPSTAVYDFSDIFIKLPKGDRKCKVDELLNNQIVLCNSFDSFQELSKFKIEKKCSCSVIEDVFKGVKQINWKYCNYEKNYYFRIGYIRKTSVINSFPLGVCGVKPFIILQNSKEQFVFQYPKKGFSLHRFEKGDAFHFVFENGGHLEFQLKSCATKTNDPDLQQVSFSMLPQDIKQFANNNVRAIRCEFKNGDAPLDLEWENEASAIMLKLYFQKYIEALLECGVDIDKIPVATESIKRPINELGDESTDASCFVYLMKDESNGYHKIGISNKPEYRERTLQSEKPTIVLLCAKKFPSRIIAEAIEAALHKAYGNKRLRGEWFELDNKDVMEIVTSLS